MAACTKIVVERSCDVTPPGALDTPDPPNPFNPSRSVYEAVLKLEDDIDERCSQ